MKQRKTTFVKASITRLAKTLRTPDFPQTLHRPRLNARKAAPGPKPPKRDNPASKSRDIREDRGTRQMKTTHNPKLLFHMCALL
jgi:hypothetical protein